LPLSVQPAEKVHRSCPYIAPSDRALANKKSPAYGSVISLLMQGSVYSGPGAPFQIDCRQISSAA